MPEPIVYYPKFSSTNQHEYYQLNIPPSCWIFSGGKYCMPISSHMWTAEDTTSDNYFSVAYVKFS